MILYGKSPVGASGNLHLWRIRGHRWKPSQRYSHLGNIFASTDDKSTPPDVHTALEAAEPGCEWRKSPRVEYIGPTPAAFVEDAVPDEWLDPIQDWEREEHRQDAASLRGVSPQTRWSRIRREFSDLFHGVLGVVWHSPAKAIDHVTLARLIRDLAQNPSLRRTVAGLILGERPVGGNAGEADSVDTERDGVARWLSALANDRDLRFFATGGELLDEKAVVHVSPVMLKRRGICAALAAALCFDDVTAAFNTVLLTPLNANPKEIIAAARECRVIDKAFHQLESSSTAPAFCATTAFMATLCAVRQARAALNLLIGGAA